ncbi:MAG: hypothetical protein C5B54_05605 [Acidobacteria bacterium]|nr:MAG: hypothetical protein C5B54_05605 [Acidobacteriota bacterium]
MSIHFHVSKLQRIVYLRYLKNPTVEEFQTTMKQVFAHPDFSPGFSFLVDRSKVKPTDAEYMHGAVDFTRVHRLEMSGRWAVVIFGTAAYGLARMGQLMTQSLGIRVKIFADFAEAENWLLSPE